MVVIIPQKAKPLILLAKNIYAQFLLDNPNSVLNYLNMADMEAKRIIAQTKDDLMEQKSKDSEQATEQRDIALGSYKVGITKGTVLYYITKVSEQIIRLNSPFSYPTEIKS